ncbi:MAG TPA: hypothetical protein VNB94_00395 [Mycobacteriales bacterium]|nr:hypothetical protein [Mycobacteriales bacterium]
MRRAVSCVAIGVLASIGATTGADAKQYGDWTVATAVTGVNSSAADGCPIESPDGQSLYLMSTRGPGGDQDIWVAARGDDGQFAAPQMLPAPVNTDANDFCPTPLRGHGLLFVSNRSGTDAYGTAACGGGDIYLTRRSPATGDWAAPRNLGCQSNGGPNGPGTEFGPSLVDTDAGTQLFYSTGGPLGASTQDIYVSRRLADGSFGPGEPVAALNSSTDDVMPNVRKDGLEVVFASTRSGGRGAFDIWSSTRSSVFDTWSAPVNLGPAVNSPGPETRPSLSWHGTRLYFGRSGDIFTSSR